MRTKDLKETLKDEEDLKHQKEWWKFFQRGQWGEVQGPLAARRHVIRVPELPDEERSELDG